MAPAYNQTIDNGVVVFTPDGTLHTVNWLTYQLGLSYYLPGGRVVLGGIWDHGESDNMLSLVNSAATNKTKTVITQTDYYDLHALWDVTANVKLGVAGAYMVQKYADDQKAKDIRFRGGAWYFF
jgi:hypothetical protein